LQRGDLLFSLYLLFLSLLPLSSAIINILYFSPIQSFSFYSSYNLFLQQFALAEKILPLVSCILGVISLLAFIWSKQSGRILSSIYLVLFVVSRFVVFLVSYQPQQTLLLITFLFPDTTFYHSAAYLVCTLVALPALIYVNRD